MPVLQQTVGFRLVGLLGGAIVRAADATWRTESSGPPGVEQGFRTGARPAIAAFWHRQILGMLGHFRNSRVAVPVSQHRDGEYVAQVMQRVGIATVRGSSSTGGAKLLRDMMAMVDDGYSPVLTPDGPRGPKFSVQPGIWMLARRTGMPVYPVGVAVRDAWSAGSWDEFLIPKPFTRIVVRFGQPLHVGDYEGREVFCNALQQAMFDETAACWHTIRPDDDDITTKDTKGTKNDRND
jgi:lysophospholipid acyltransferase (LPLAT)-like uncharacterized protein